MVKSCGWGGWVGWVAHVIIVSAPVQRIGFWGFSVLVRTFVSGLRDCWDGGLGLGLGLDNKCYVIPLLYLLAYCLLVAFYINLLDFDMNLICNSLFWKQKIWTSRWPRPFRPDSDDENLAFSSHPNQNQRMDSKYFTRSSLWGVEMPWRPIRSQSWPVCDQ